jgi:glutathione synthase/RimK-type ligase-like ATP-grasp enzyme
MRLVFLAKQRHAAQPTWQHFVALGPARGHRVEVRDKKALLADRLADVDVVCIKSWIDDTEVWRVIEAAPNVRAVNTRAACAACGDRLRLDRLLRDGGVRTPGHASTAAEVQGLRYPIIRKPVGLDAARDVRVLHEPPAEPDVERCFYQERITGDGATYKAYAIGAQMFLVKEFDDGAAAANARAQRLAMPMSAGLAAAVGAVGRLTGLAVYGVDLVGSGEAMHVIDVNPFPSFQGLPQAADALWDYLETEGAASPSPIAHP